MAMFEKRSLIQTIALTVCTLGLYLIYWVVTTKRELNKAGGHVPNAILMIIPLANLYFWYRYAQSYAAIVKRNNHRSETMAYFLVALMPSLASFTGLGRIFSGVLSHSFDLFVHYVMPHTSLVVNPSHVAMVFGFLTAFGLVIAKITIFQDGYNEYQG